jgi:hypothetical protein
MSHLDEGTLHALLDGELDLHEVREIQAHLGSCTACDSRFQAAKDVYGEADRLVTSVQFPGAMKGMKQQEIPAAAAAAPPPSPAAASAGGKKRRIEAKPVANVGAPQVVILPEQNDWPQRRRRWLAGAKWAAVFCVAIGAGFLASEARKNSGPAGGAIRAADSDEPNWVVSQDEMTEGESLPGSSEFRRVQEAAAPTPKKAEPKPPAVARVAQSRPATEVKAKDTAAEDTATDLAKAAGVLGAREEQPAESDEVLPAAQGQENIRAEAAEALAQLDAQRRRDRAAAATAALDRQRRETAARQSAAPAAGQAQVAAAPPPPPPPPTLEQRSGIYLRIGLDEAARQLGRPVHVIEGLSAQFMGLVQGSQAPGADDNRPAVRVVYQDTQARMILLDQQRIRPGQTWPASATQWSVGEIGLALHGDVPGEVLRNLRPRVR